MDSKLADKNKKEFVGDDQILMMKKKNIINGTVTLMKKKFLDSNEIMASLQDRFDEFLGRKVSFQLISSSKTDLINGDPHHPSGYKGRIGKASFLENWASKITPLSANDISFTITFDWNKEEMGLPGAFIIQNFHSNEFYLKTLTLKDIPGHNHPIIFICNSWIYPSKFYENDRVFFTNQTYLPSQTPSALSYYREQELEVVRGKGTGMLQEWDRVYDYDIYNDLGDPDKGDKYNRPILGGSKSYPYPRRCRTGRPPANKDPRYESRLSIFKSLDIYIPRDERFSHLKMCDVVAFGLKTIFQFIVPGFETLLDTTPTEFDKIEDILEVYEKGIKIPDKISSLVRMIKEEIPFQTFKELLRTDGERFCHFPVPQIIQNDKDAWSTDEEFAREMLAGLNPVVITRLEEFPTNSMLLKNKEQIVKDLEGLSIDEALKQNKLFKLDYHDAFMPYLNRINNSTSTKIYATRTLLFLKNDGTLKPLAIELSLPNPKIEDEEINQVYMPAENGIEGTIWKLAKAYVAANDSGYHQLICHWLHTHAVMEPFIIATNRQLSVVHPIYKLLHPHFRDTMNLNALARQGLINGGGLLERTIFPSQFCMEFSSLMYNDWTFPHQALPADLLKRGVAIEDKNSKHGIRLLIEDYPYAVDGLEIWSAIKTWVKNYCSFYYKTNNMIQEDSELQSWWNEIREKGHPDKKDEPWWPKMEKLEELIEICTIIIWVASALHAAVNFGQYPYGGYLPNRPAMTRRLLPEQGTDDYEEMGLKPEKAFLKTVTSQLLSIVGISLVEILSRHSEDEVFLGQRENMSDWTMDKDVLEMFEEFGRELVEVEKKIVGMNEDGKWRNRVGPGNVAYTLLLPSSEVGLTGRGIPNSVSM